MIMTTLRILGALLLAYILFNLIVVFVPPLLTAGPFMALIGYAVLALCVAIPAAFAWNYFKGKIIKKE